MIINGDCVEVMAGMPAGSVDAIVTDPPYGLEFMGKEWDRLSGQPGYNERGRITDRPDAQVPYGRGGGVNSYQAGRPMQAWHEGWAREALRVLKPGGHLLAFGGTRTYHRLACAIEDAGFEIRDCLAWMYGSGFPKSLDVSKAIDKAAGAEREVVGEQPDRWTGAGGVLNFATDRAQETVPITSGPATPEAQVWQGWGTALKPAHEPIVLARKPLTGTVAGNVQAHGTGALNVDGCRIGMRDERELRRGATTGAGMGYHGAGPQTVVDGGEGRWPANVILDPEAAAVLDEQTGNLPAGVAYEPAGKPMERSVYGATGTLGRTLGYFDTGGASRFYYVPKASSAERNAGLNGFEAAQTQPYNERPSGGLNGGDPPPRRNVHPTVKPIQLMRWLCRLVTPPGGTVLDPFTGSGTTGIAATLEHFQFIGIEREPEYAAIAEARIEWWAAHPDGMDLVRRLELEREAATTRERGQLDLFGA